MGNTHNISWRFMVVAVGLIVAGQGFRATASAASIADAPAGMSEAERLEMEVAFLKFGPDARDTDVKRREETLAAIEHLSDAAQRERLLAMVQQRQMEDLQLAIDLLRVGPDATVEDMRRREDIERAVDRITNGDVRRELQQRLEQREAEETDLTASQDVASEQALPSAATPITP